MAGSEGEAVVADARVNNLLPTLEGPDIQAY